MLEKLIMNKKKTIMFLAICFILTQVIIAGTTLAEENDLSRISGADCYQTAVQISQKGWESADYAFLARGDRFADALCAGPLASQYDGPILLTQPDKLNSAALQELKRLGIKHLYIIGGTGAITESVEGKLKAEGIEDIKRIYGKDRYETSVKIAEKIGESREVTKAALATGANFPDALSISGVAAEKGMPILLTSKESLPEKVKTYFGENTTISQTYIVGGNSVISRKVAASLINPLRLAGSDRYQTNTTVLKQFDEDLDYEHIYIATGSKFADALTGAVLAAKSSAPLVLTPKTIPEGTADYLESKLKLSSKVRGLGGKSAVPSSVIQKLVLAKEQIPAKEKYNTAGIYGPETGSKTIDGSVIISSRDVTLQNTIITGDLLLGRSIGDGEITLKNVTVQGKTIVNGGGPNSILMYNFQGQTVIVDIPDGSSVRLVAQGDTNVDNIIMDANGTLEESQLTGDGFALVTIPGGAEVNLIGNFTQVDIEAAGVNVKVTDGRIETLNISSNAQGTGVDLSSGSQVSTLNVNADTAISGEGHISRARINAEGVTIEQNPAETIVSGGLTATVGGQEQTGTTGSSSANSGGGSSLIDLADIEVMGTVQVGEVLTAAITPAGAQENTTFQWQRAVAADGEFSDIEGANQCTYVLKKEDEGKYLKVQATGNGNYRGTVSSSAEGPVTITAQMSQVIALIDQGYTPVANAEELTKIRNSYPEGEPFGEGTIFETSYTTNGLSSNYVLAADIDLSQNSAEQGWEPVGTDSNPFAGVFDGNGYVINNLVINRTEDYIGLFGYTNTATLKNLTLKNINITGNANVGGLAGVLENSTITDCRVMGDVTGTDSDIGGLVGESLAGSTITKSYAAGTVSGDSSIGGIAGTNSGTISNTYTTGMVQGNSSDIGGLAGKNEAGGSIAFSYTASKVSGSGNSGGLVGYKAATATVSECYWNTKDNDSLNSIGNDAALLTDAGKDESDLKMGATYSGWDFMTTWGINSEDNGGFPFLLWQDFTPAVVSISITGNASVGETLTAVPIPALSSVNYAWLRADTADGEYTPIENANQSTYTLTADDFGKYIKVAATDNEDNTVTGEAVGDVKAFIGSGTSGDDPYLIKTLFQLNKVNDYLDAHFRLENNIDLQGNNFKPIGYGSGIFKGVFDGNGYKIYNGMINYPSSDSIGFFTSNSGTVKDLGVENVNVTGSNFVGGLAGSNRGNIMNSYTTGAVSGGGQNVGGLVGYNWDDGTIKNSHATGAVYGGGDSVGGLVGWNYGGHITTCYATGNVTADSSRYNIGGLVGYNYGGNISNCYAAGNVGGVLNHWVGGLVGRNRGGIISNCYAIGNLTGFHPPGGLIGHNSGTVSHSYWDIETTGQTSDDSDGAIGKTTTEMMTKSTYTGWDFVNIWNIDEDVTYPYLRPQ